MAQKMCSKDSAYSRETLEEIKDSYIKEKDVWRHFFGKYIIILRRKLLGFEP